jgi:uncharacterized membrane protein
MLEKLNIKQKIALFCLVAVVAGVIGWVYEFFFYYLNSGFQKFYMRGGNFLPWINIYMYGCFLIIALTYKRRKHPLQVFLISVVATGLLEYFSGYVLYGKLGWTKCWDYNQEILNFGNINGYVCLRSVLFFGISALALMYIILPLLVKVVSIKNTNLILIISIVLCSLFLIDEIYNLIIANVFHLPRARDFYKSLGWEYLYFK